MDDVLGADPWLITRCAPVPRSDQVQVLDLDCGFLAPFRRELEAWLDGHAAEAVLVRPDRYVFGAGEAQVLLSAWARWTAPLPRAA